MAATADNKRHRGYRIAEGRSSVTTAPLLAVGRKPHPILNGPDWTPGPFAFPRRASRRRE